MGCHMDHILALHRLTGARSGVGIGLVQDRHLLSLRQMYGLASRHALNLLLGACSAFAVVATEDSVHPSKIGLIQVHPELKFGCS
jgi:hypothetical protein